MDFSWVEPLPDGVALLDAKLEDGRLRLEVEGALTTRDTTAIGRRFADLGDVEIVARYRQPRRCVGHMEREARRLQLRYVTAGDEHMENVMVAEDDERVVVFGVMCVPAIQDMDQQQCECPYHVYLKAPLGDRTVIDGFTGEVVPYRNVYTALKLRLGQPLDETDEWIHT